MTEPSHPQLPSDWHEKPNTVRIYDYWLGGTNNFSADRAADHMESVIPDIARHVQANRQFLQRAVRALAELGIDQFLDLGSGLPSVGNVHQIVQEVQPNARIVYVDNDPVLTRARAILDFDRLVAVLLFAVLHFILDDAESASIVESYRAVCAPGSYLALSHGTVAVAPEKADEFATYYNQTVHNLRLRTVVGLQPFCRLGTAAAGDCVNSALAT